MAYKIDLSGFSILKQDAIYSWFNQNFGGHGKHQSWNYHHQPSCDKYWIDVTDEKIVTMFSLVWAK